MFFGNVSTGEKTFWGRSEPRLKPCRGRSSAGRAPALQAGGHEFDPRRLHQFRRDAPRGRVAQLVEHALDKRRVIGSNPIAPTSFYGKRFPFREGGAGVL